MADTTQLIAQAVGEFNKTQEENFKEWVKRSMEEIERQKLNIKWANEKIKAVEKEIAEAVLDDFFGLDVPEGGNLFRDNGRLRC